MSVLFVLAIIAASLFVIGLAIALVTDEPAVAVVAFVFVVAAMFLTLAGFTQKESAYNRESVNICEAKGGVVTKDNHCFKDNKPIEFEPGVWQRNW